MIKNIITITIASTLIACSTFPPIKTAQQVDLPRFMGDWYVIAHIPTWIEKEAHNAMESYQLKPDGSIATTFTFRKGSFDGQQKTYHPTAYVSDKKTNAVWGMQLIWPIKADYRIVHVDNQYSQTIIGRNQRDYVWIMARTPEISDADLKELTSITEQQGYDISKIKKIPQRW